MVCPILIIRGNGGDGGLGLGIGICAILADCDDVGRANASGGDGGDATAINLDDGDHFFVFDDDDDKHKSHDDDDDHGRDRAIAIGGDGGDGGLALGIGICAILVSCEDVGRVNTKGDDDDDDKHKFHGDDKHHGRDRAIAIAIGGDGGDGGLALAIGICAILVSCEDVGRANASGGDGGTPSRSTPNPDRGNRQPRVTARDRVAHPGPSPTFGTRYANPRRHRMARRGHYASMSIEQAKGTRLTPGERQAAERRLQEAVGDGLIELDEFDGRIDIVLRAQTRGDLEPAFTGLPADRPDRTRRPRRMIAAVLGEDKVDGPWRPADKTITVAALGETTLDFRHAQLDREEVAVTAVAWLGEVNIVVPPDVEVEMSGFALLGERKDRSLTPADDRGPLLRLRAFAVLGEIKVRTQERDRPASALPALAPAPATHPRHRRSGRVARWLATGGAALALLGAGRFVGSFDAAAVFGDTTYRVPPRAQQVDTLSLFGSVDVIVPPDVRVEPRAFALFGSQDCLACERSTPEDSPVLVIRSFTLFGSLDVR